MLKFILSNSRLIFQLKKLKNWSQMIILFCFSKPGSTLLISLVSHFGIEHKTTWKRKKSSSKVGTTTSNIQFIDLLPTWMLQPNFKSGKSAIWTLQNLMSTLDGEGKVSLVVCILELRSSRWAKSGAIFLLRIEVKNE